MANYKSIGNRVTTTQTTVYTNNGTTPAYVMLARVTNISANTASITAVWVDSSNGNQNVNFVFNLSIPAAASVRLLEDRLVLEPGDSIQAKANVVGALDLLLSVMEA